MLDEAARSGFHEMTGGMGHVCGQQWLALPGQSLNLHENSSGFPTS